MGRERHKRKMRQLMLVTSDGVEGEVKQYRYRPWRMYLLVVILCMVIGGLIGYLKYEQEITLTEETRMEEVIAQQVEKIFELESERGALLSKIELLDEKVQILSDTVNTKTESESILSQKLEKQATPSEFPLTGSASMEEVTEGNPMCIFTASVGAMVVASAHGTVTAINDENEYGHNVWIDHGNGYITIYRNQGDVKVKLGEEITQGTTLFLISQENNKLGYQMMKDGEYINPMDMLIISG